jgi:hypothetical protein
MIDVTPESTTNSQDHREDDDYDILKRHVRGHLPIMRLLWKAIPVTIQKQATLLTREKQSWCIERMSRIYWYDPKDLISTILSATNLTDRMHFGMALIADESTEYYHSQCWGSSNFCKKS